MKLNCLYCDYGYEVSAPQNIMRILSDPDLPIEDYMLWMDRFVKTIGFKEYNGMLIHTGMMHRGKPKGHNIIFTEEERSIIENDKVGANFTGPTH